MRRPSGFTVAELLAASGLAVVFCGIVATGLIHAREAAHSTRCLSNLRQWGVALSLHVQDNDGRIPRRGQGVRAVEIIDRPQDWFNALPPYLGLPPYSELSRTGHAPRPGENSIFVCPAAQDLKKSHFIAYGMNMYLSPWNRPDMDRLQQIANPSQLAFLADGPGGWASTVPSSQSYSVLARHRDCANVLFVDGHVKSFSGEYLGCGSGNSSKPDIRWMPGIGRQEPVP